MSSKLVKLPFSILAVSGYEENFPPEGLITSQQGWQTERFCIFPQSVILSFNLGKCRIKKIQLLIHEFKIPKKVEFFAGLLDHDDDSTKPKIDFHKLGFIDLFDNSHNSYKSRELKSIHVDFEATHLKVSLHKNYINSLNLYNQVGLVAINLLGEVMDSDYLIRTMSERNGLYYGLTTTQNKDPMINGFINQDAIDKRIPFLNDLSFDFHQDTKMIKFMTAVSNAKIEAVKLENFEVAKALKTVLNDAKRASSKILKLQMQKEKYVQEEDYDGAQKCKTEIEDIKLSLIDDLESFGLRIDQNGVIYSASVDVKDSGMELAKSNLGSNVSSLDSISGSGGPSALLSPVGVRAQSPPQLKVTEIPNVAKPEPVRATPPPVTEVKSLTIQQESIDSKLISPLPQKNTILTRSGSPLLPAQQKLLQENQGIDIVPEENTPQSPSQLKVKPVLTRTGSPMLPAQQKLLEAGGQDFEKPQSPKESNPKPEITRTGSPMLPAQQKLLSKKGKDPEEALKGLGDKSNEMRSPTSKPKNAPKDLTEPEPLSASQLEQFGASIDVFQLFVVQHTLSINFKCREYGLAEISNKITEWKKNGKGSDISLTSLCKATTQLAGYCLDDTREKSSLLTLGVLSQLLEVASHDGANDGQIYNSFANLLNSLITKAGDTNPRVKSNATDILKKLLKLYHQQPNSLLPELLKPFKDKKKGAVVHPKLLKSRLEILSFAISEYGLSDQDHRFSTSSIMSFVQPMIDNTNNDVRDWAFTVVAQICVDQGDSYTSEYTNSLRDAQKEILSKKITSLGGAKSDRKRSVKFEKPKGKQSITPDTPQKDKPKAKEQESITSSKKEESLSKRSNKKDDTKPTTAQKSRKAAVSDEAISEKEVKKASRKSKSDTSEEQCLFCEGLIKMTGEDSLEKHYTEECPYLVECPQCGLVVEITLLQTHMYGNCEQAPSDPKSCDRCHLLISSVDYMSHRSKKKCKIWNIDHDPSICGLCKKSIMGKSGWKVHVLTDKKCISKRKSKKK